MLMTSLKPLSTLVHPVSAQLVGREVSNARNSGRLVSWGRTLSPAFGAVPCVAEDHVP